MRTIPQQQPGHVLVELVWPESRGEKADCKNYTGTVWSGRGDVQNYPANLWPKLREHHDVWRLYCPADADVAANPTEKEDPAAASETGDAEGDLKERQQEAAGRNTDLVAVMVGFEDDGEVAGGEPAAAPANEPSVELPSEQPAGKPVETVVAHSVRRDGPVLLTLADLQAMSVQAVRELAQERDYMLHPRMKAEKLYEQFLNMQALRAAAADGAKA